MSLLQKSRKLVAFWIAIAVLTGVTALCPLRASAANNVTYAVKYVPAKEAWCYQSNTSSFEDSKASADIYLLRRELRPGDLVVVYNQSDSVPALDLGTTRLGNLTVAGPSTLTIIYSGYIDECYLLGNSYCCINADIRNAYVYDTVTCNFNRNVKNLYLYPEDDLKSSIGTEGTVDYLYAASRKTGKVIYTMYNFPAAALAISNGKLETHPSLYTTTPNEVPATPVVAVTAENFDHVRYANDYPDAKAAFGLNAKALYKHYTTYGIKEGRVAYPTSGASISTSDFDYVRYANDYPDLKAAFGYNAKALYNHYVTYGIAEKRGDYSISSTFDHVSYANDYPDLKAAFGYDAKALYNHYITYGIAEKRGDYYK